MRWDVFGWAAFALVLVAAETLAPGAFMLWLGLAAAAVFVGVLLVPGIPLLVQVAARTDAGEGPASPWFPVGDVPADGRPVPGPQPGAG